MKKQSKNARLKEFISLFAGLEKLGQGLELDKLPAKSDERLKSAELQSIHTIMYLLDECITNLREEIKKKGGE